MTAEEYLAQENKAETKPSATDYLLNEQGPQLRPWEPTLTDKAKMVWQDIRQSRPVEAVLGRTAEDIQVNPASPDAPTTHDAGVMGLFNNSKPVMMAPENPKTSVEGLHAWAAGVVNSVASPGGIATAPVAGPAKVMGPIVQKALLLTFGAQGAGMTYEGAKDLLERHWNPSAKDYLEGKHDNNPAATVMDVGNILAGSLMMAGGKHALKKEPGPNLNQPPTRPTDDFLPPEPPAPNTPASVAAQTEAALDPNQARAAVLETPGEVAPPAEAGLQPVATAQGTAHINPAKTTPAEVQAAFAEPNAGGELLGMASNVRPETPTAAVTTRDAQGTPVLDEAVTPETQPAAVAKAKANVPEGGTVEVRPPQEVIQERLSPSPETIPNSSQPTPPLAEAATAISNVSPAAAPSRIAQVALSELTSARQPVPASLLPQAGIAPEALAEGYKLNAAGTHYEFTAPPEKLTPQQTQAREAQQAMVELRAQKGEMVAAEEKPQAQPEPQTTKLIPVDVTPDEVKAAAQTMERPPDILDVVGNMFPNGVKFAAADHGEVVKTSRGEARRQMSHTKGEPADQVIKALHEEGHYRNVQTADDLAQAMKAAGETRIGQRNTNSEAVNLARQQKRTKLFETAMRKRANAEPMPANQLFVGDQFKLKGSPVEVVGQVMDAETGIPSHVEIDGAFGRQTIPANAMLHLDRGTLKSPSLGEAILAKLESMKVDTNGQLHAFGLLPEAWNLLIESVRLAVKGGVKLADAIEQGIAKLKASGADLKDFEEAAAKQHLQETLGIRQFGEQVQRADDVSADLKGEVTNTLYQRRPQEADSDLAARIVQTVGGPEAAIEVFRDQTNGLPAPVRMAVGMQIVKGLDAAGKFNEAARFFDNDLAPHTTDVAQGLAMLNAWHAMSAEGKLMWAQRKIAQARQDALKPVTADIEAAKADLQRQNAAGVEHTTADAEVQAGAKQAIVDTVANSPETHNGIVMELTQPWASAQVILDMARKQVAAKANDILTKQPRPVGFTAAQHLRAIMDDLAQRAADIAASHYQGAEPGVILRDKLMQRLGIRQDAAGKLANALDKEFARQVEQAKSKLDKRIARQLERAKQGLPADPTETAVDRSIRQQLAEAKVKLGKLVRQHWTKRDATGKSLRDKLVQEAGLSGEAAAKLAAIIERRFAALTTNAKRAALEKLLKPVQRMAKPKLIDRLIELSNLGALDAEKYWNAVRERLDLPEWSQRLRDRLKAQAEKIQRIAPDKTEELQRAQIEFLNELERAKGISNLELGLGFYFSNILTGITTHGKNLLSTALNTGANLGLEGAKAIVEGRAGDLPLIWTALGEGFKRGGQGAINVLRTGQTTGSRLQKLEAGRGLELVRFGQRGGVPVTGLGAKLTKPILENPAAKFLNAWKYNYRLMAAEDLLFFKPAEEVKAAMLASRLARSEGLRGRDALDRSRQIMGYGAEAVRDASAKAASEGHNGQALTRRISELLEGKRPQDIRQTAKDFALRSTFNNDPYGFMGSIAHLLNQAKASDNPKLRVAANVITPFTNIVSNVVNESLNYTPAGLLRARARGETLLGKKLEDMSLAERKDLQAELRAKALLGTGMMVTLGLAAAQYLEDENPEFAIYANGPANDNDRKGWQAAGGLDHSIKIGNKYYSYATSPMAIPLAWLGNIMDRQRDAIRYNRPGAKRLLENLPAQAAAGALSVPKVITEQSFLSGITDLAKTISEPNPEVSARSGLKMGVRMAGSLLVPNGVRQVDRFFDPTVYEQRKLDGMLVNTVPFVRGELGRPSLNALGLPVSNPLSKQFASEQSSDALVNLLNRYNVWPATPDRNNTKVNGIPLTDDEYYTYVKARGDALRRWLNTPEVANAIKQMAERRQGLLTRSALATDPAAKARYEQEANGIMTNFIGKYEDYAAKVASQAVIRMRPIR